MTDYCSNCLGLILDLIDGKLTWKEYQAARKAHRQTLLSDLTNHP